MNHGDVNLVSGEWIKIVRPLFRSISEKSNRLKKRCYAVTASIELFVHFISICYF